MADLDTSAIDPADALRRFTQQQAPLYAAARATTGEGQKISATAANAAKAVGDSNAAVAVKEGEIEARKNTQAIDVAAYMDVNQLVKDAHGKRLEAQRIKDTLLPQIQADAAVTPWDDPLKWIVTQFTAPKTLQAYTLADTQDKDMTQRITAIQRDTQQQQAIDLAPTADMVRSIAQDKSIAAQAKGIYDSAQIELEAKSKLVQQYALEIGGNQALFNNWSDFVRTTLSVNAQNRQVDAMDRAERRMTLQEEKAARLAQDDEDVRAGVEGKLLMMGQRGYKRGEWAQLSPQVRSNLVEWSRTPVIGDGLGESVGVLADMKAFDTFGTANPAAKRFLADTTVSAAFSAAKGKLMQTEAFTKLPEDKQRVVLFTETEKIWDTENKSNPIHSTRSAGNPTKLNMATVTQWPELTNNHFAKSVRELQALNPEKVWTEKDMLDMFQGQIAQVSPDAPKEVSRLAKEFSAFYRVGMQSQFKHTRARLFGMEPISIYGISTAKSPAAYEDAQGVQRAVNAFNPVEVEHYAMQFRAKMARRSSSVTEDDKAFRGYLPGQFPPPVQFDSRSPAQRNLQSDPPALPFSHPPALDLPAIDAIRNLSLSSYAGSKKQKQQEAAAQTAARTGPPQYTPPYKEVPVPAMPPLIK
jgi:hypothetical protein